MRPKINIILIGFMAAGKSTVGTHLAKLTGSLLKDLDHVIAEQCGRSISEIFAAEGEPCFRFYETQALKSVLNIQGVVVATGGGIVAREENWPLMRSLGRVVYLRCSWETLRKRLAEGSGRPLVIDKNWERIHNLFLNRISLYEKADLVVDSDNLTPYQVAQKIMASLDPKRV